MVLPEGFYIIKLENTEFVIPTSYRNLKPVGSGAFGSVCSAEVDGFAKKVAVKKLNRPFLSTDHAKRTYRELVLLRHMQQDNVLHLLHAFTPQDNQHSLKHVYFVCPYMEYDLRRVLDHHKRLTDDKVQLLVCQLLRGLKYMHSAGIIHRDLKPSNIGVNRELELKILDFGLARQMDYAMTGYVVTRYYRAPEVMLHWMHYNEAVDIWSVGCIMAEMVTGTVLFPGADRFDQLVRILEIVGTPCTEFLGKIEEPDAREYITSLPHFPKQPLNAIVSGATDGAIDLLENLLQLDPDQRPTAVQSLCHAYLESYHDETDEPTAQPMTVDLESDRTMQQWKDLIWNELQDIKGSDGLRNGHSTAKLTSKKACLII